MKRRVTYRPSKAQGVFGMIWGAIFVLIGLGVVVPAVGAFGLLWTLAAVAITVYQGYLAFGKNYAGPEINIEEDASPSVESPLQSGISAEERMKQLRALYDQRLITAEEYEQKRQEILKEL